MRWPGEPARPRVGLRLPVVALVLVVFTVAYAAASSLEVTVTPVPQVGQGGSAIVCQASPLSVGYRVDRSASTAVAMTVAGLASECDGIANLTLALQPASTYFAGGVNYVTVGLTDGTSLVLPFASAVPLLSFTTGDVTVVIDATTGVSVVGD